MSTTSFPVAWQSGPYRFVGKAYVQDGELHLTGTATGAARRRRTTRLHGLDIAAVSTCRVNGQPGLAVDHCFGVLQIELLAGSWGAAHDLADAIAAAARPGPGTGAAPHRLFHGLPEAMALRCAGGSQRPLHTTTSKEVQP